MCHVSLRVSYDTEELGSGLVEASVKAGINVDESYSIVRQLLHRSQQSIILAVERRNNGTNSGNEVSSRYYLRDSMPPFVRLAVRAALVFLLSKDNSMSWSAPCSSTLRRTK